MFIDSKPVVIVYFTVTLRNRDLISSVNITDNVSGCYCTLLKQLPKDLVTLLLLFLLGHDFNSIYETNPT